MIEFTIRIADRVAGVRAMFESTRNFCAEYLCSDEAEFSVEITREDIHFERRQSAKEDRLEGRVVRNFPDDYMEVIALQRKISEKLFEYDTLLFHGSCVAVDGDGYLFTAKSGTGKSTHTRLWREVFGERAVMVNDDKPFLNITKNCAWACGSPWNGKHGIGNNIRVPLRSICILCRGEQNRIRKIPASEAVFMLLQQSNRPRAAWLLPKYMELVDCLSRCVEFYRLECTMEAQAAEVSYMAMSGKAVN